MANKQIEKSLNTKYQHLFFDLDHTLWDFETNSKETLGDLFIEYKLEEESGYSFQTFLNTYYGVNDKMWELYRNGKITRDELRYRRFRDTFATFNYVNDEVITRFESDYMSICPTKPNLMVGALDLLETVQQHYQLHIITNGFNNTQAVKLKSSGLDVYFKEVLTSDEVGVSKPDARIFIEALKRAGATRKNALMIGDNLLADVLGAKNCGIDQAYYNPAKTRHSEKVTLEISQLADLKPFLGVHS